MFRKLLLLIFLLQFICFSTCIKKIIVDVSEKNIPYLKGTLGNDRINALFETLDISSLKRGQEPPSILLYNVYSEGLVEKKKVDQFLEPLGINNFYLNTSLVEIQKYYRYRRYMHESVPTLMTDAYKEILKSISDKLFHGHNSAEEELLTMLSLADMRQEVHKIHYQLNSGIYFLSMAFSQAQVQDIEKKTLERFSEFFRSTHELLQDFKDLTKVHRAFISMLGAYFKLRINASRRKVNYVELMYKCYLLMHETTIAKATTLSTIADHFHEAFKSSGFLAWYNIKRRWIPINNLNENLIGENFKA